VRIEQNGIASEKLLLLRPEVPGGASMVKLIYCINRKAGMSDEEFFRNGKTSTARLVVEFRDSASSSRAIGARFPGNEHEANYDGIAELWFDDVAALLAARQSAGWKGFNRRRGKLYRPQQSGLPCFRRARHHGFFEAGEVLNAAQSSSTVTAPKASWFASKIVR
jgi:EthD domain